MATTSIPRVWLDGEIVPPGTWVHVVEEGDPERKVRQLDAYEPCRNGNLGPLIEIMLPDPDAVATLIAAEMHRQNCSADR
jgi:hypothetical protein